VNGTAYLTYKWARRVAISVVGGTVLLAGVAMIVLPGPAFVVIPLGLAILGLEFAWARHWLRKVRERAQSIMPSVGGAARAQRASETTSARNSPYERTP
jgi:uncharacterized protein (TIGR02611 family)